MRGVRVEAETESKAVFSRSASGRASCTYAFRVRGPTGGGGRKVAACIYKRWPAGGCVVPLTACMGHWTTVLKNVYSSKRAPYMLFFVFLVLYAYMRLTSLFLLVWYYCRRAMRVGGFAALLAVLGVYVAVGIFVLNALYSG